jgi:hypothetical protein
MKNATKVTETNLNWGRRNVELPLIALGMSASRHPPRTGWASLRVSRTLQISSSFISITPQRPGGRPDFSKPPVSDLFARIFDLRELAASSAAAPTNPGLARTSVS